MPLAFTATAVCAEDRRPAFQVLKLADLDTKNWPIDSTQVKKEIALIEQAATSEPVVQPAKPRKVLVYGRPHTHDGPVQRCFVAIQVLGAKSGAFETVWSGDPAAFLPENLAGFDAVVMNNTHEGFPFRPQDFKDLDEAGKAAAQEREKVCQQSLLEFVRGGRGVVGIHGATASVQSIEYDDMLGADLGGLVVGKGMPLKVTEPEHPLCASLGKAFEAWDEIYGFSLPGTKSAVPFSRQKVRVLVELDRDAYSRLAPRKLLETDGDPQARWQQWSSHQPNKFAPLDETSLDFAVSWVKPYGKGRVFYCSLGHMIGPYASQQVMRHYLAGVQFAIGDLEADSDSLGK